MLRAYLRGHGDQKGISLPALQRLLRHDRLITAEFYLHVSPEEVIREFREKW